MTRNDFCFCFFLTVTTEKGLVKSVHSAHCGLEQLSYVKQSSPHKIDFGAERIWDAHFQNENKSCGTDRERTKEKEREGLHEVL